LANKHFIRGKTMKAKSRKFMLLFSPNTSLSKRIKK
jgi:hypothetical protein